MSGLQASFMSEVARQRDRWLARAVRVEVTAHLRDDRETYGRAAGLLARIHRRMPLEEIADTAAEMAHRHARPEGSE